MLRTDFSYELPQELIAQHPLEERTASRLLCLDGETGAIEDRRFCELESLLNPGDLLVVNDTRVIPARIYGQKETGGRLELLLERLIDDHCALAQLRVSRAPRPASRILLNGGIEALVLEACGNGFFKLQFNAPLERLLELYGHMPLPPYIQRGDEPLDRERYQTVYAKQPGAVAAPTAGLHFDEAFLERLREGGVECAFITLHVGAGTFQPVRESHIEAHKMHSEYVIVGEETCRAVKSSRARGNRVIAVGTTVVRSLETAAAGGEIAAFRGETDLFVYPGYRFRTVHALITNFHLPESTLLMLVCAFAGSGKVLRAYAHAVECRYRFFSYGDAMWVTPDPSAPAEAAHEV